MQPRDRGHAAHPALDIAACQEPGRPLRIIAFVQTGACRFRNQFLQACRRLGLKQHKVQAIGDRQTAYLVRGLADALAELTQHRVVVAWHFALPRAVVYRGTGWGERPKRRRHPLDERLDALRTRAEAADEEWLRNRESESADTGPAP